jgi:hypothetical protein
MREIVVGAMVSMDGVMQAPDGPREDPTKGFKFGGWEMPYFDQEFGEELDRVFKGKFAASRSCSTRSRSTRVFARARSIRAGRARCSSATSPT